MPVSSFTSVRLSRPLVGLGSALALAFALPGAALAYGDAAWGISTDTLSDMIQQDMLNRSLESLQDAAGISGDSARESTPKKSVKPVAKPTPQPRPSPPLASRATLDVSASLAASGRGFSRGSGMDQLAGLFPKAEQAERKQQLATGIIQFGDAAQQQYGVPRLNLATGVTAAIAGGYAAYTGEIMPDSYIKPLFEQMEGTLRAAPRVTGANADAKATSYQIYMGLGLLLTAAHMEAQKSGTASDKAKVRQLGAATLQGFFGVHPSRIRFSSTGYTVLPE